MKSLVTAIAGLTALLSQPSFAASCAPTGEWRIVRSGGRVIPHATAVSGLTIEPNPDYKNPSGQPESASPLITEPMILSFGGCIGRAYGLSAEGEGYRLKSGIVLTGYCRYGDRETNRLMHEIESIADNTPLLTCSQTRLQIGYEKMLIEYRRVSRRTTR